MRARSKRSSPVIAQVLSRATASVCIAATRVPKRELMTLLATKS